MNTVHAGQKLELHIQTEGASFEVGEPVYLEISLRNTGKEPVKALKYFMLPADDANKNNLEIQVYDAAGNRLSRISHVLTGRALYYPEIYSISPGDAYRDLIQLAGTFIQRDGRKKIKKALWCLGENPEITSASEYPSVTPGNFKIRVIYHINNIHLVSLNELESSSIWKGQLISNTIEISMK